MTSSLAEYKTEFLEYLEIERGRALKTIENYDRYLSRFLEHSGAKNPKDVTERSVREFRLWLNRQEGANGDSLKRKTQNYYMIALRAFLKYMRAHGVTSLSPERIELAKVPERDLDLITHAELKRLLGAPRQLLKKVASTNTEARLRYMRDTAILELLFSTGLRVSELVGLDCDLDLTKDEMSVRGKGDKVRVVFFSEEAKKAVHEYLGARVDMEEPLFINLAPSKNVSPRLTARSVERLVKHYAVVAGITKKVTPHGLRHSFATDLLQNGADIRSVQALLGHANIATTQIYTHITDKHLRDVHKRFHDKK